MRFGNGRDGLNSDPGKMIGMICSDLGLNAVAPFPADGSWPAYSQECLPKAQAEGLLNSQGDIKRI